MLFIVRGYLRRGKICWAKRLRFQPHWSLAEILSRCLGQKYFLFSIIKERHLYSWENFRSTLESHEKCKSLAQQILPRLRYIIYHIYHWSFYTVSKDDATPESEGNVNSMQSTQQPQTHSELTPWVYNGKRVCIAACTACHTVWLCRVLWLLVKGMQINKNAQCVNHIDMQLVKICNRN